MLCSAFCLPPPWMQEWIAFAMVLPHLFPYLALCCKPAKQAGLGKALWVQWDSCPPEGEAGKQLHSPWASSWVGTGRSKQGTEPTPCCLAGGLQKGSVQMGSHRGLMAEGETVKKMELEERYKLPSKNSQWQVLKIIISGRTILRFQHSYFSRYLQVIKQKNEWFTSFCSLKRPTVLQC